MEDADCDRYTIGSEMKHGVWFLILLLASCCVVAQDRVGGDYASEFGRVLAERFESTRVDRDKAVAALMEEAAVLARQRRVRSEFIRELGGLPAVKTPLNARVTGKLDRDGYTVEKVIFESLPGFRVTANLYLPKQGRAPFPAVLGTAGHTDLGKSYELYQTVWVTLAQRGVAVLAYDPPGQGERIEYLDPQTGKSRAGGPTREHSMTGMQCLLTGQSIARYFVWDGIRAFDYLLTRREIDPNRIAVAGNSGGGTQAAYLGVAEPRLAAVVSSCYPTTWRDLWAGPGPQDMEQVTPNWLRDSFDFSDFMLAAAPRFYLISSAVQDYFPIAGSRRTYAESGGFYRALGHEDRIHQVTADQEHGWSAPLREGAYTWLGRAFGMPELAGEEHGTPKLDDAAVLAATPSGQLQTSIGSRTTRELNREYAAALRRQRQRVQEHTPLTAKTVRSALQMRLLEGVPRAVSKGIAESGTVRVEKLELETEPGIRVPAFLYLPPGANRKPGVIFVSSAGKANTDGERNALALALSGQVVLAVDPRGMGEAAPDSGKSGYDALYQLAARTWLLGESLAGMQVNDILASLRYLKTRPEVESGSVSLYGQGTAGPLVLFAAAIDPSVIRVTTERSMKSFDDLVNADLYRGMENLIVPGLLTALDLPELTPLIGAEKISTLSPLDFSHPGV